MVADSLRGDWTAPPASGTSRARSESSPFSRRRACREWGSDRAGHRTAGFWPGRAVPGSTSSMPTRAYPSVISTTRASSPASPGRRPDTGWRRAGATACTDLGSSQRGVTSRAHAPYRRRGRRGSIDPDVGVRWKLSGLERRRPSPRRRRRRSPSRHRDAHVEHGREPQSEQLPDSPALASESLLARIRRRDRSLFDRGDRRPRRRDSRGLPRR